MWPRPESLGYSVYLTSFERQREELEALAGSGAPVFLSLHISEEFSQDYCRRAEEACRWLKDRDYRILADISTKTVAQFGQPDLIRLAERLGIWALRVDYGFTTEEIAALAAHIPVVVNASTTSPEDAARIAAAGPLVMAMHTPAGDRPGRQLLSGEHKGPPGCRAEGTGLYPRRRGAAGTHP